MLKLVFSGNVTDSSQPCEIWKPYLCFARGERRPVNSSDHLVPGENLYLNSQL